MGERNGKGAAAWRERSGRSSGKGRWTRIFGRLSLGSFLQRIGRGMRHSHPAEGPGNGDSSTFSPGRCWPSPWRRPLVQSRRWRRRRRGSILPGMAGAFPEPQPHGGRGPPGPLGRPGGGGHRARPPHPAPAGTELFRDGGDLLAALDGGGGRRQAGGPGRGSAPAPGARGPSGSSGSPPALPLAGLRRRPRRGGSVPHPDPNGGGAGEMKGSGWQAPFASFLSFAAEIVFSGFFQ